MKQVVKILYACRDMQDLWCHMISQSYNQAFGTCIMYSAVIPVWSLSVSMIETHLEKTSLMRRGTPWWWRLIVTTYLSPLAMSIRSEFTNLRSNRTVSQSLNAIKQYVLTGATLELGLVQDGALDQILHSSAGIWWKTAHTYLVKLSWSFLPLPQYHNV